MGNDALHGILLIVILVILAMAGFLVWAGYVGGVAGLMITGTLLFVLLAIQEWRMKD